MARSPRTKTPVETPTTDAVLSPEAVTEMKKARVDVTTLNLSVRPSERSARASHSNAGRKPKESPYADVIQNSYETGTAFELNSVSLEVVESVRSHLRTVAQKLGLGLDMSVYEVAGRSDVVDVVVQAREKRVLKRKSDSA